MKLGRITGVILSILFVVLIGNYYLFNKNNNTSSFELIGDNGSLAVNEVHYDNQNITSDNKSSEEIIEYSNKENYPVTISSSNISVTCTGDNENDEQLVEKNYSISASFSTTKNGSRADSLEVLPDNKVYIHVISSYNGKNFPTSEVKCEYSISVNAGM